MNNKDKNRRGFPRIAVTCPVLYRVDPSQRQHVAKLVDFSATGIRIICDENIAPGRKMNIHIKSGSQKTVPELSISGVVLRCEENDDQKFEVSCKISKIHR
ncbi:MAG: PilZ domain-containing protein [Ectothiorhodospiraceae bacterium]|nr:PilZ domain-containing protein [Ectothiorhodospiraceae bacterium]